MSFSKRLEKARIAFLQRAASGKSAVIARPFEAHGGAGAYVGDLVYGGLDGIVTTFAIVSGVAGAQLGANIILILGVANLLADGFSMATGAYLSVKSQREYYDWERQKESKEVEAFPDSELLELYDIYRDQGYSEEDARTLVEIKARNPERLVDAMMIEELNMLPSEQKPFHSGLATFIAFILAGSVPLLAYLFGLFFVIEADVAFSVSLGLSALTLFGLGAAKKFVTNRSPLKSGLEMMLVGGLAAAVAYTVGALLKGLGQ